jgi:hypothetical protein
LCLAWLSLFLVAIRLPPAALFVASEILVFVQKVKLNGVSISNAEISSGFLSQKCSLPILIA